MAIYFIQVADWGPVKIGFVAAERMTVGRAVERRRADLQVGNPWPLVVRAVTPGTSVTIEQATHDLLRDDHIRGEWFHPSRRVRDHAVRMSVALSGGHPRDGTWALWKDE